MPCSILDSTGAARAKDAADPGPGYASFGGPGILPTGGLGGWAPGAMPRLLPDGVGKFLRKGSDLVLQIHYHPDGKAETDQSVVGVYFTQTPARKIVGGIAVRSRNLDIPPGERAVSRHRPERPLAGRRSGHRHHAPHALHRQGDEGRRRDARRQDDPLDLDQGLGLQLAGPVPVHDRPSSSPRGRSSSSTPITTTRRRTPATRASRPSESAGASRRPTRCACWVSRS